MPSARLQQQFIRLWQCCEGKSQETTLNELAALLSCSRRHMRTLLNTMQDRGWLTWEAEVGRGKRSRLTFLYTGLALQQQRAAAASARDGTSCACSTIVRCVICYLAAHCAVLKPISPGKSSVH